MYGVLNSVIFHVKKVNIQKMINLIIYACL